MKRRRAISFARTGLRSAALMLWAAACAVLMAACASDECNDNKNSLPLAEFYSSLPTPERVSIDSVSVFGIGAPGDSVLVDSASSLQQVYLPFRIDQPSTTYVIRYLQRVLAEQNMADTIRFDYAISPQFVSSACGAVYYYDDIRISHTNHFIDSVTCPGNRITNANLANIFIYFRINEGTDTVAD